MGSTSADAQTLQQNLTRCFGADDELRQRFKALAMTKGIHSRRGRTERPTATDGSQRRQHDVAAAEKVEGYDSSSERSASGRSLRQIPSLSILMSEFGFGDSMALATH